MHSSMPHTTHQNWNNERIKLNYDNAATGNLLNDEVVAELIDSRIGARPSTRPTNIIENRRRSI